MKPNRFEIFLGSGFFSGFSPFASGTVGSLVALPLIFGGNNILIISSIIFLFWGILIANKFETQFGKDPSEFTLDEFVGTWISFIFIPLDFYIIILIFFMWRFFDILKPFPIKRIEKLSGGFGIMFDDVLAGIYANIFGQIIIYLTNL